MTVIPKDPVMLLSYINTQLRDFYPSLEEFCKTKDVSRMQVVKSLEKINYKYDEQQNRFV